LLAVWPALAGAAAPVVGRVLHGAEQRATAADLRERAVPAPSRPGGPGPL
jgi:hypothetical protein